MVRNRFPADGLINTNAVSEGFQMFSGFIFDVEGTLVDCIPQTLKSLLYISAVNAAEQGLKAACLR